MTARSQFPEMDDLDRLIDDVARGLVAGDPERVSAATIRGAIAAAPAPRSAFSFWLSLAAVLLVGFLVVWMGTLDPARSPATVAKRPAPMAQPVVSPSPDVSVKSNARQETASVRQTQAGSLRGAASPSTNHEPYEGLPRLIIPVIQPPDAIATMALEDQGLEIPRIDIAPLQLSALDHEQH